MQQAAPAPPTWFLMPSTDPVSSSTLLTTSLSLAIISWKVAGPPGGWPQQRRHLEACRDNDSGVGGF
jgi:hypothetical protein